jgi:hypothetical protein
VEEEEEEEGPKPGTASMKALEGPCPSELERIISLAVVCLGGGVGASGGSGGSRSCALCQHTSAYASIRQHTPAYVSIRQHTPAYASRSCALCIVRNVCWRMLAYADVC